MAAGCGRKATARIAWYAPVRRIPARSRTAASLPICATRATSHSPEPIPPAALVGARLSICKAEYKTATFAGLSCRNHYIRLLMSGIPDDMPFFDEALPAAPHARPGEGQGGLAARAMAARQGGAARYLEGLNPEQRL